MLTPKPELDVNVILLTTREGSKLAKQGAVQPKGTALKFVVTWPVVSATKAARVDTVVVLALATPVAAKIPVTAQAKAEKTFIAKPSNASPKYRPKDRFSVMPQR